MIEMKKVNEEVIEAGEHVVSDHARNEKTMVHTLIAILLSVFLLGLYWTVSYTNEILPTPLSIVDERFYPDAFIAERAQRDLKELTDIGPKVVGGHENEVLTVEFLLREIEIIQKQAHTSQKIEVDLQTVTGSYLLNFNVDWTISAYGNVQNVVVKFHSQDNSKNSLLLNAHFDTAPTSSGASDDGISCALMLEILRKLACSSKPLRHNVVFLFNGAEESLLQGSHGFITQHKWAPEISVFLNLDAGGVGGKEVLFQADSNWPWLLEYYQLSPHPRATTLGEELFESGVIPSDSDYKIFKAFGSNHGMDFAFVNDAQRYHTQYDSFSNIPAGSYQHAGDNYLNLVRQLANSTQLGNPHEQHAKRTIFYDFLGLFLIYYSQYMATILHWVISMISVAISFKLFRDFGLSISWGSFVYLFVNAVSLLAGWFTAALLTYGIATALNALNLTMSWYSNSWLIFGLYVIPIVASCCVWLTLANHFYNNKRFSVSVNTQVQIHLLRFIWSVILLMGSSYEIRSTYLIFVPLLFQTISAAIIQLFSMQHTAKLWKFVHVLGTIIPNLLLMNTAQLIILLILGTTGRMGSTSNPELYIFVLTLFSTLLITSSFIPLLSLVHRSLVLFAIVSVIFITFCILCLTPLGFPYNANAHSEAPQRFAIYHTNRIIRNDSNVVYKSDSGFLFMNQDRNSPMSVKKYVKELSEAVPPCDDCENRLYCGLPTPFTLVHKIPDQVTWIPTETPIFPQRSVLKLISKTIMTATLTRFTFSAAGHSHLQLYVSPRHGVLLNDTNLIDSKSMPQLISTSETWNGRPVYGIMYVSGARVDPLIFTLDFESPTKWKGPLFDVTLIGTYKDEKKFLKTPEYTKLLDQFPTWTVVVAYIASYESWVY